MTSNVVFVSTAKSIGGAERSLMELATRLTSGTGATLVAPDGELFDEWRNRLPDTQARPYRGRLDLMRQLYHLHRDNPPSSPQTHVVVFSLKAAWVAAPIRILRNLIRPPLLTLTLDLHDYLPTAPGRLKLRAVTILFDRIVAVSQFAAMQIAQNSPAEVVIRRRPTPRNVVTDLHEQSTPFRIGVIGRIDRDKNIELAIDAVSRSEEPLMLITRGQSMVSTGSYAIDLIRSAQQELRSRYAHEGQRPNARALDNLDAVLVSNHKEAMGRTVLEAQAAGVLAIVPDAGGASELVVDGVTGLRFRHGDWANLRAVLEWAHRHPRETRNIRTEALRRLTSATTDADDYVRDYFGTRPA